MSVRKKLVLIQFSRAFVPLIVMLFHTTESMYSYFKYNFLGLSFLPISGGVNYFFALTGFMMYYIYRESIGKANQLTYFLLNRFIRIYPLYWILTIAFLTVYLLFPNQFWSGVDTNIEAYISSILLLPNSSETDPFLIVAWSLVHTVFFYFIFSLLFFFKINISKWILSIWGVLSIVFYTGLIDIDHYIIRFLFNFYNIIFLTGIVCAHFITCHRINFKWSITLSVIGFLGFPFTWLNYFYEFIHIDFDFSTGLSSALLILGLASIDLQKDIKIPKVFNYLGNAAFSIYLSHNVVLDISTELYSRLTIYDELGGWLTMTILMILMLIIGCFTHSFIEKPLIKRMKKIVFKRNMDMPKMVPKENKSSINIS
ncbi:acyltransferase family protein [Domibacillus epiphyticus]|uniref:Acyltransferase 3 domain-containing protein n=1 Tax=Domibacillus epiphyticus TaxID=1714355 RepID=A0A1V2A716_9BACI|nr:acyltransferase [Domibacillus epiphyticus]OMP66662.1 hypothetical protein BTO28_11515 [Domibacillus epiphyticus]